MRQEWNLLDTQKPSGGFSPRFWEQGTAAPGLELQCGLRFLSLYTHILISMLPGKARGPNEVNKKWTYFFDEEAMSYDVGQGKRRPGTSSIIVQVVCHGAYVLGCCVGLCVCACANMLQPPCWPPQHQHNRHCCLFILQPRWITLVALLLSLSTVTLKSYKEGRVKFTFYSPAKGW